MAATPRSSRLLWRPLRYALSGLLATIAVLSLDSSSQASATRCATNALHVVSFGGQGAAGTEFAFLRFELRRPGHCTLSGYPGVTVLNGRHRFNIHVGRRDNGPPRTVRLDAGHPAYFSLAYRQVDYRGHPNGRPCHARITGLRIIPPNDRKALTVRLRPSLASVCLDSVAVEAVAPR